MKNAQVYNCPSSTLVWPTNAYSSSFGYGFNDTYLNRIALASVVVPAETILFADSAYYLMDWDVNDDNHAPATWIHNSGPNLAFMDGHVKWMNGTTVSFNDGVAHASPPSPNLWDNQ